MSDAISRRRFAEQLALVAAVPLVAKLAMVELAGGMGYNQANASFAIGSETSGSILTPAAFCGVTGLRPTYGLVSRHGAMALSWTTDKPGPERRPEV